LGRLRNPAVYKILINLMILEKLRQNCHYEFCDVQQNLKVQATIHSQLSYFTLNFHTSLSKKMGGRKKGIIFMSWKVNTVNPNSNPSILKLFPTL
jgi:hypothetical protein